MGTIKNYERCTLHAVEYRNHSTVGNPSYWVYFTDSAGEFHRGCTGSNSSAGYTIQNYSNCDSDAVIYLQYHLTKRWACVVTAIQHNSPKGAREAEAEEATKNYKKVNNFLKK